MHIPRERHEAEAPPDLDIVEVLGGVRRTDRNAVHQPAAHHGPPSGENRTRGEPAQYGSSS